MARCRDTTQCPGKIRGAEERPLEARGGAGHASSWPRPPVPAEVGRLASGPGTGDSAPGEGDGASRGRSLFSTASAAPCVPTQASESDSEPSSHRFTSYHAPGARGEITGLQGHG